MFEQGTLPRRHLPRQPRRLELPPLPRTHRTHEEPLLLAQLRPHAVASLEPSRLRLERHQPFLRAPPSTRMRSLQRAHRVAIPSLGGDQRALQLLTPRFGQLRADPPIGLCSTCQRPLLRHRHLEGQLRAVSALAIDQRRRVRRRADLRQQGVQLRHAAHRQSTPPLLHAQRGDQTPEARVCCDRAGRARRRRIAAAASSACSTSACSTSACSTSAVSSSYALD